MMAGGRRRHGSTRRDVGNEGIPGHRETHSGVICCADTQMPGLHSGNRFLGIQFRNALMARRARAGASRRPAPPHVQIDKAGVRAPDSPGRRSPDQKPRLLVVYSAIGRDLRRRSLSNR